MTFVLPWMTVYSGSKSFSMSTPSLRLRQIHDVADRRLHLVVAPQVLAERLRLGGRLDDDEILRHASGRPRAGSACRAAARRGRAARAPAASRARAPAAARVRRMTSSTCASPARTASSTRLSSAAQRRPPAPRARDREPRPQLRRDLVEHVLDAAHQRRALAGSAGGCRRAARTPTGPGHGEHLAPLLQRVARRDQRAAAGRRLDHHRAEREPADEAIAAREMIAAAAACRRGTPSPARRWRRPARPARRARAGRPGRCRSRGRRPCARPPRAPPRWAARVDPGGETADHREPGRGQAAAPAPPPRGGRTRSPAARPPRRRRGSSAAQRAADDERQRRIGDRPQPRRIGRIVPRAQRGAEPREPLELAAARAPRASRPRRRDGGASPGAGQRRRRQRAARLRAAERSARRRACAGPSPGTRASASQARARLVAST